MSKYFWIFLFISFYNIQITKPFDFSPYLLDFFEGYSYGGNESKCYEKIEQSKELLNDTIYQLITNSSNSENIFRNQVFHIIKTPNLLRYCDMVGLLKIYSSISSKEKIEELGNSIVNKSDKIATTFNYTSDLLEIDFVKTLGNITKIIYDLHPQ